MSVISSAKSALPRARARWGFVDHLVRMWGRYQDNGGDRLAAGVTFYWFLSLFPILLLAISILGYVYGDQAQARVSAGLNGYLPAQLVDTIGQTLNDAKGRAGVIGLAGLLLSGLGWIDGLREAVRVMWHRTGDLGNIIVRKVSDVVVLAGLFATIAASVIISGATTAATDSVLSFLGASHTGAATVLTQALAYLLAGVADTALFLFLFTRLPKAGPRVVTVLPAAVFGAVGFEILKFAGAFYVARTTSKGEATYGTFAVVVGLLLFLNLVSRLILLAAAFAVTAPYDSDVLPSGTAEPGDDSSADDAAPGPAIDASRAPVILPVPRPAIVTGPPPRQAALVQGAARVTAGAIGAALVIVGVGAARTIRSVLSR